MMNSSPRSGATKVALPQPTRRSSATRTSTLFAHRVTVRVV